MRHELEGDFGQVRVRPLREADIETVRLLRNSMRKWFVCCDEISREEQKRWYGNYLDTRGDYMFAAQWREDSDSAELLGTAALYRVDAVRKTAEFGRLMIAPGHSGRGAGYQTTMAVCRLGFEALELSKITLQVYRDNRAAGHIYEKAGFVCSGSRQTKTGKELLDMSLTKECFKKFQL